MRPTSLAVRGLKSWGDFQIDLEKFTALMGPNGIGKTAIIQAIRLALLGYDPETGKQLKETRTLIDPAIGVLEVGLSFDTGFGIRRFLGAKTKSQVMPSRGEGTNNECQARIDEETGGLLVVLNLAEFLDLSDEKRREWFFAHLPGTEGSLDFDTFKTWTASEADLDTVVLNLWEKSVQVAPNPVIGLGNAIEVAHAEALAAERKRHAQNTIFADREDRLRAMPIPKKVKEGLLQDALDRIASVNQRIGQARAGREAADAIRARASRFRVNLQDHEVRHAATATELKDLEERLENAPAVPDLSALEKKLAEGVDPLANLREELDVAVGTGGEKRAALHTLIGQRTALEERGPCPYADLGCTTDPEALTSAPLEKIHTAIEEAEAAVDATELEVVRLSRLVEETEKERGEWVEEIKEGVRIKDGIERANQMIADKRTRLDELSEQIDIDRKELAAAEVEERDLKDDDGSAALYQERDDASVEENRIRVATQARVDFQRLRTEVADERTTFDNLKIKEEALKDLDANLRRLRAHVIRRMIEPLHQEADNILRSIDPHKRFRFQFERENRSTMEIGFEEDGVLRLFNAASKGERAMLAVSFLCALLAVLDPKMKLLIVDDVEKLWPENRGRLMEALVAIEDRLDAVVMAGACDFPAVENWDIVDLREYVTALDPEDEEEDFPADVA